MRAVLIQLAMTSNGNTAKMDGNSGGGSARHYADALLVGWLDPLDAPHQRYLDLYMREADDAGRERVLELAEDELDRIRFSRGHAGEAETLDELFDRIVALGEGWEVNDVAVAMRTTARSCAARAASAAATRRRASPSRTPAGSAATSAAAAC
jgi:hypothetical protein